MFVASGLNNVITIANGTNYFFDQAGLGDYIAARKGSGSSTETFDDILPTIGEIKS
jgi:putative ABC transport system permease protein